mgnify:FL=1
MQNEIRRPLPSVPETNFQQGGYVIPADSHGGATPDEMDYVISNDAGPATNEVTRASLPTGYTRLVTNRRNKREMTKAYGKLLPHDSGYVIPAEPEYAEVQNVMG